MQSKGSCRGMPYRARQLFFLSIQICLICISDKVSFVKVKQNLFISGDIDPGSVPQAQPLIPIINAQRTTQKYLNSGRQPFFTKDWQVMSIARAIKNKPMLCLVFLAKKRADSSPPINPANRGIYFCFSSSTNLLKVHMRLRKIPTKLPTNRPNLIASFPDRILKSKLGFLMILFIEKRVVRPALIRQVTNAIFGVSVQIERMQLWSCLQYGVLAGSIGSFSIGEAIYICSVIDK